MFLLLFSMFLYTGTGSGVGTYVLNILHEEFPEIYRSEVTQFIRIVYWIFLHVKCYTHTKE